MADRTFLLRVANVNPESIRNHTDRALYSSIAVFIVLYFVYATVGAASFIDSSSNYAHPWWQWLVGPPVAMAVIAYDRAVVGRVAVNYEQLDSGDPHHLLKRRTFSLYAGRMVLAILFAVVITEPLMLARYKGEIDAYLAVQHSAQLSRSEDSGAIAAYARQIDELERQDAADDKAVADLHANATAKRQDATTTYNQALADSKAQGVTQKAGCPSNGFCDTLVQQSRSLTSQAAALDTQANRLQDSQQPARQQRAVQKNALQTQIRQQREVEQQTVAADSGFGARTEAMWHLATRDFWGFGFFYLGVAVLLIALDCAAVWLKLLSHGNAYERAEARDARRREHEATLRHQQQVRVAKDHAERSATAAARIRADAVATAAHEQQLINAAVEQARAQLERELELPPTLAR
jgi:hypothetical protein